MGHLYPERSAAVGTQHGLMRRPDQAGDLSLARSMSAGKILGLATRLFVISATISTDRAIYNDNYTYRRWVQGS